MESFESYKLMQEIFEIQEEIKLKNQQITNRMKLLHNLNSKKEESPQIRQFLKKLNPEYPLKCCIEYQGPEPIPMRMEEPYEPIPMKQGEPYEPIPMNY